MKHIIPIIAILGCISAATEPPAAKVLPEYHYETGVVRLSVPIPEASRLAILVGNEWHLVAVVRGGKNIQGETVTILRTSDGKKFVTYDGSTWRCPEGLESNGERDIGPSEHPRRGVMEWGVHGR